VVTDYGGTIQVSSAPGAGTTIRVRMPVRPEREASAARVAGAAAV
jgi:signal transduction histidine kinase